MEILMKYIGVIVTGGTICLIAQILIDKTKLTSARILVIFVVSGVILSALGIYDKIKAFGYCGATIPLVGFGHALYQGVVNAIDKSGFLGIFTGGLPDVSAGIVTAVFLGLVASLVSKSKFKQP